MCASLCLVAGLAAFPARADVNVTEHHNHDSRDGLYGHRPVLDNGTYALSSSAAEI